MASGAYLGTAGSKFNLQVYCAVLRAQLPGLLRVRKRIPLAIKPSSQVQLAFNRVPELVGRKAMPTPHFCVGGTANHSVGGEVLDDGGVQAVLASLFHLFIVFVLRLRPNLGPHSHNHLGGPSAAARESEGVPPRQLLHDEV